MISALAKCFLIACFITFVGALVSGVSVGFESWIVQAFSAIFTKPLLALAMICWILFSLVGLFGTVITISNYFKGNSLLQWRGALPAAEVGRKKHGQGIFEHSDESAINAFKLIFCGLFIFPFLAYAAFYLFSGENGYCYMVNVEHVLFSWAIPECESAIFTALVKYFSPFWFTTFITSVFMLPFTFNVLSIFICIIAAITWAMAASVFFTAFLKEVAFPFFKKIREGSTK